MPAWRNGRRTGLKILSSQERIGSSPIAGTTEKPLYMVDFRFNLLYIVVFFFLSFLRLSSPLYSLKNKMLNV